MGGRVRFGGQETIKVSKDKSLFYQRGLKSSRKEISYIGEVVGWGRSSQLSTGHVSRMGAPAFHVGECDGS